jgi:predicted membrane protein
VRSRSTLRGDTLVYTLEHNNPVIVFPFDDSWNWNLGLTTQIPLQLDTSIGAGSMDLILDAMIFENLSVSQGVGEVEVILPDGDYHAEVDQAIGQIVVEIPRDIPIRLNVSRTISSLSLPSEFEQYNDYYYSPGARDTEEFSQIEINQAIGNIIVRYSR